MMPDHDYEMPYERFVHRGAGSLTNAELLAVILRTGTRGVSALALAGQVLSLAGKDGCRLGSLCSLTMEDLQGLSGIGEVKAVKILALAEISRRIAAEKASENLAFSNPSSVAARYMEQLRHEKQERAVVLLLDSRLSLIREDTLSIGTVNMTLMSPRDVFSRALRCGAVNLVLLHNHPSGDPTPSDEDIIVTKRMQKAGELLDISLVDHIIIGDLCYSSMGELGYL